MTDNYLIDCIKRFQDLPEGIQEAFGGFDSCLKIKTIEEAYNVSLSFAVILVAINELTVDDLPDYLVLEFKLDRSKAEEITKYLDKEIFGPVLDLVLGDTDEDSESNSKSETNSFGPIVNLNFDEKKELILKTFTDQLIPALLAEPDKLQDFNIAIFQAFNIDDVLEDRVESLLYNNQEKIGDHQIILDNHPASPSIANWLKDFIKKYGSDIFNEVILAEYLSQSLNVKQLKPNEKELVRKLLKLYYNLVFFPESMDGVPLENWQIFPIDEQYLKTKNQVAAQNNDLSKNEETDKTNLSKITEVSPVLETTSEPVVSERQKIIFDLQKNLTKYPVSSLEYKAVRQEINRLSRK